MDPLHSLAIIFLHGRIDGPDQVRERGLAGLTIAEEPYRDGGSRRLGDLSGLL